MSDVHAYRGWRSTRLHLALITMAAVTAVYWRVGFKPEQFDGYCMALIAAAGIFSGTSTADRFAARSGKTDPV